MSRALLFSVGIGDCKVQSFTVSGPGGGGKDTSNTGVRIIHPPSGAVGEGRESRSQLHNKRDAFTRMAQTKEFKAWHKRVTSELLTGKSLEDRVAEAMEPRHIRVEVRNAEGKWEITDATHE